MLPDWLEAKTSDGLAKAGANTGKALWNHSVNRLDMWVNNVAVELLKARGWLPWGFTVWEMAHLTHQESHRQGTTPLLSRPV